MVAIATFAIGSDLNFQAALTATEPISFLEHPHLGFFHGESFFGDFGNCTRHDCLLNAIDGLRWRKDATTARSLGALVPQLLLTVRKEVN